MAAVLLASVLPATAEPRELSSAEKAVIEEAVRDGLKDPESARFKWLPTGDASEYCGQVNAKNSYGGYGGFKTFLIPVRRDEKGVIVRAVEPIDWVEDPDTGYGGASPETVRQAMVQRCVEASR